MKLNQINDGQKGKFIKLVIQAFPATFNIGEIISNLDDNFPLKEQSIKLEENLRNNSSIDWTAYAEKYNIGSDIDHISYFLEKGVYEGHKLFVKHKLMMEPNNSKASRISIIIVNNNQSVFLLKIINSLLAQNLKDIEIIVVDCSLQEQSYEVLRKHNIYDSRLVFSQINEFKTDLDAFRYGVRIASGDYIMFANANGFYRSNGLEKVWKTVAKGNDAAVFDISVVNLAKMSNEFISYINKTINSLPQGVYNTSEFINTMIASQCLIVQMQSIIMLKVIAYKAFEEIDENIPTTIQWIQLFMLMLEECRSVIKIKESFFSFIVTPEMKEWQYAGCALLGKHITQKDLNYILSYSAKKNEDTYYEQLKEKMFNDCIKIAVENSYLENQLFVNLKSLHIDKINIIENIYKNYKDDIAAMVHFLSFLSSMNNQLNRNKNIGIYITKCLKSNYPLLKDIIRILVNNNYIVSIIISEEIQDFEFKYNTANIYVVNEPASSQKEELKHLRKLYDILIINKIETIIAFTEIDRLYLWDSILFKSMGISTIIAYLNDLNFQIFKRPEIFTFSHVMSLLQASEKVWCSSQSSEIYLRSNGIDARCISPYICRHINKIDFNNKRNIILVYLNNNGDDINFDEYFAILNNIIRYIPEALMVFCGSCLHKKSEQFWQKANERGIKEHVKLIDSIDNNASIYQASVTALCLELIDGFPYELATAQSNGLPVIMLEADNMLCCDNPGIIMLKEKNNLDIAHIIICLMTNDKLFFAISNATTKISSRFTSEIFSESLFELVDKCNIQSNVNYYTIKDYRRAVSEMARTHFIIND